MLTDETRAGKGIIPGERTRQGPGSVSKTDGCPARHWGSGPPLSAMRRRTAFKASSVSRRSTEMRITSGSCAMEGEPPAVAASFEPSRGSSGALGIDTSTFCMGWSERGCPNGGFHRPRKVWSRKGAGHRGRRVTKCSKCGLYRTKEGWVATLPEYRKNGNGK